MSLVEIKEDRSGLTGLWLPEAQLRHWLAQFLCDLLLQFIVWHVQRDRQSDSVGVVDLHHHRARFSSLSCTSPLRTRTLKKYIQIQIQLLFKNMDIVQHCKYFLDGYY